MFPPCQGNDFPNPGGQYIISLYGTSNVFTASGKELHVLPYTGISTQIWTCSKDPSNYLGFSNKKTECFLGWAESKSLGCRVTWLRGCEWLTLTPASEGGFILSIRRDNKLYPAVFVAHGSGSMELADAGGSPIGLHRLDQPVFRRFQWVLLGKLARASAPHYHSRDEDQYMDLQAVEFATSHGITNIISFNSCPLSREEITALGEQGIIYTHLPVEEFGAPTLGQLETANSRHANAEATLVYSGYGQGRTGTAITALQLFGGRRLDRSNYRENNVQTKEQIEVLDKLKLKLGGCDFGLCAALTTAPVRSEPH